MKETNKYRGIIAALTNKTPTVRDRNSENGTVFADRAPMQPPKAGDRNLRAYRRIRLQLAKEQPRKFLAFENGKLIDIDSRQGPLLNRIAKRHKANRTSIIRAKKFLGVIQARMVAKF